MKSRRDLFKSAAAVGVLGASGLPLRSAENKTQAGASGDDRQFWVSVAEKISRPVLTNLARRELRKRMPVEENSGMKRAASTHLEAFGRLLCGLAPWLALEDLAGDELRLQREFIGLAQSSLDAATDPRSADFLNFFGEHQALVDAAFLAQGILRAPRVLWSALQPRVQRQIVAALKSSRQIATPSSNNWVMFAAMIETALLEFGESTLQERLEDCVNKMLGWYCGDGAYGDGRHFHFDYYNSFVIHPMLLDVLRVLQKHNPASAAVHKAILDRARRFAEVQERLVSPEGTFPALGRSAAYRFGAFQALAQISLLHELPERIGPAQVRCALTAVIRRMMAAPGTFDAEGWLQIGFCGHQPDLGEGYISTGSLYLCSAGLLPLGLPPSDEFWSAPAARWTQQKIWAGENLAPDHAMTEAGTVVMPLLKRQ